MKQPDNPYLVDALAAYPDLYRKIITDWQAAGADAIWLMYSANYLLRIGACRLAIDPITLPARLGGPIPATIAEDLAPAEVVMLSHDHSDHVNWQVLSAIQATVRQWIIPRWMQNQFEHQITAPTGIVSYVQSGDGINYQNVQIQVFEGNHWEDRPYSRSHHAVQKGLPSLAFLIEGGSKRWVFPGDTRSFTPETRVPCGAVDVVAAHVFLGRLTKEGDPPSLLDQFCEYFSGYQTDRIILAHLYELGRNSRDIWTENHATMIMDTIRSIHPDIHVGLALSGDSLPW